MHSVSKRFHSTAQDAMTEVKRLKDRPIKRQTQSKQPPANDVSSVRDQGFDRPTNLGARKWKGKKLPRWWKPSNLSLDCMIGVKGSVTSQPQRVLPSCARFHPLATLFCSESRGWTLGTSRGKRHLTDESRDIKRRILSNQVSYVVVVCIGEGFLLQESTWCVYIAIKNRFSQPFP